jgi:hypothetical protein
VTAVALAMSLVAACSSSPQSTNQPVNRPQQQGKRSDPRTDAAERQVDNVRRTGDRARRHLKYPGALLELLLECLQEAVGYQKSASRLNCGDGPASAVRHDHHLCPADCSTSSSSGSSAGWSCSAVIGIQGRGVAGAAARGL